MMPQNVEIISMTRRPKEGGVFVMFEAVRGDDYDTAEDVAKAAQVPLIAHPKRTWLTTRNIHVWLVRGNPFIQDVLTRFPSTRIRIELRGAANALNESTVETVYHELRRFGRINDIALQPYVKDQPRIASVQYRRMHSAVAAMNCLHRHAVAVVSPTGQNLGAVTMYLNYDSLKVDHLYDFVTKNPRLSVPFFALLFTALTFLIFDPLRTWNVKNKITHRFSYDEVMDIGAIQSVRRSLRRITSSKLFSVFKLGSHDDDRTVTSWSSREADEAKVTKWISAIPDKILFLTGAKGAGKQALVKKVTAKRKNVLTVDFSTIADRSDEEFVKGLSQQVGFTPGFGLLTWINSIMDIFTPGASKATGASQAFGGQIAKILEITSAALISIAANSSGGKRLQTTPQGDVIIQDSQHNGNSNGADDNIPLFVIDGFNLDNKDKHSAFMQMFVQWSAAMTASQLGRFLFLTDSALAENISKTLPDIKLVEVSLSDADTASALQFVTSSIGAEDMSDQVKAETERAVSVLGGRYSDLLSLVRQLESNMTPTDAVEEIVNGTVSNIRALIWNDSAANKWSRVQLWQCINLITASPLAAVGYDDVLFAIFNGDEVPLKQLVRADVLRIEPRSRSGSQDLLKAGSPVYYEAFHRLVRMETLKPGLDLAVAKQQIAAEIVKIQSAEDEIGKLTTALTGRFDDPGDADALVHRRAFVAAALAESHSKLARIDEIRRECEAQIKEMKATKHQTHAQAHA